MVECDWLWTREEYCCDVLESRASASRENLMDNEGSWTEIVLENP